MGINTVCGSKFPVSPCILFVFRRLTFYQHANDSVVPVSVPVPEREIQSEIWEFSLSANELTNLLAPLR